MIFINNDYYKSQLESVEIKCQTLNKVSQMQGYSARVKIKKIVHKVYVVFVSDLEYDCILNHQIV